MYEAKLVFLRKLYRVRLAGLTLKTYWADSAVDYDFSFQKFAMISLKFSCERHAYSVVLSESLLEFLLYFVAYPSYPIGFVLRVLTEAHSGGTALGNFIFLCDICTVFAVCSTI